HLYLPDILQTSLVDPNPSIIYDPGVGTGWRDIDYDATTGNLYLRAVRGIAKGVRDNMTSHDYTRPDGTGPGIQTIVNLNDGFDSAINIEFLPASFAGQDLLIVNRRVNPNTFAEQIELYDPNAIDTQVAITFLAMDGSPFMTANADSGIYDFSYDPIHELLYISDFSSSQIHIFGVPGGPTADFNGDGDVTREDLLIWQTSFGIDDGGDADADGDTDGNDFLMWQTQFGSTSGNSLSPSTIPEPQSMILIAMALSFLWIQRGVPIRQSRLGTVFCSNRHVILAHSNTWPPMATW
ncbi:MAG: hypothetical protein JW829_20085, partial [Pirellulales bacterium]|nr:hypothetical protein [Pirellulales bacterium]